VRVETRAITAGATSGMARVAEIGVSFGEETLTTSFSQWSMKQPRLYYYRIGSFKEEIFHEGIDWKVRRH